MNNLFEKMKRYLGFEQTSGENEMGSEINSYNQHDLEIVIKNKIDEMKKFRNDITLETVLENLVDISHVAQIEINGKFMKHRGCQAYGGCACIGKCRELIPFTELDRMHNDAYAQISSTLTPIIEKHILQ